MRRDLPDASFGGRLKAGLCLEGLSARIIPWRDEFGEMFPPRLSPASQLPKPPEHEIQIFITVNVIRKSDGLMSPFVPRHNLRWSGGHSFGRGEESPAFDFRIYTFIPSTHSLSRCVLDDIGRPDRRAESARRGRSPVSKAQEINAASGL